MNVYITVDPDTMDLRATAVAHRLARPLIAAALLTIPTTVLQLVHLGEPWRAISAVVDWAIWLAFAGELLVMLAVTRKRGRYLFDHPLDIAIVVLTPPFFLAALQSIRVLRLLRLLRVFRIPGLADRVFSTEGVRFAAVVVLLTAVGGGAAFGAAEHVSFGNGVYWAASTMATVGSIVPKTTIGKVLSVAVMLIGIGAATLVIGAVANRFFAHTVEEVEIAEDDLLVQIREISQQLQSLERAVANRKTLRSSRG
ncbi:MAG: potassium channel family protein [Solirubrobacteraceae bacterium]